MELVMRTQKTIGSRRHVLTRFLVTTALLGSTFLIGLATTASAAPPYHLVIATPLPSTTDASGAALAVQPTIDMNNQGDNPDPGAVGNVTATVTSAAGSLVGTTVEASTGGVATFINLGLNELVGSYKLTFTDATDSAAPTTSAPITVTVGASETLAFAAATPKPAGAVNAVALTPQPIIDVVDSGGNIVTGDTSTVTATTSATSIAGATKAAVAGVATFSALAITNATIDTNVTLNFADGSLTPIHIATLAITGAATKLIITTQPSTVAVSGGALTTQPVVDVEDANGAVVKADTSTVTAALVSGPGGSSITNATKAAVAGVATFVGLAINATPGNYSIIFSDGALTTATTTVPTAIATKLLIATQPSTTAAAGAALAIQP